MAAPMVASTSGVMDKIMFVHKLHLVIKATSDDDMPTAGFLYQEITDLTFSTSHCKPLLGFLVERLEKPSHHVKFKVLRVMKHAVENGSEEFCSGLLRRSAGIQLATKFSGPPDPLHGNAPYIAVRTAAKELSEILFDTEKAPNSESGQSRATSSSGGQTPGGSSSMEGFGNDFTPIQKMKSINDTLKEGFRQLTGTFRQPPTMSSLSGMETDYKPLEGQDRAPSQTGFAVDWNTSTLESSGRKGYYKPVVIDHTDTRGPVSHRDQPSNRDVTRVTSGYVQGKPAGGWEDGTGLSGSNTGSNSDGQHSGDSTELSERLDSVSVEDFSLEMALIQSFVNSSDYRLIPSREDLNQFVKSCFTLNCEKVTEMLSLELRQGSMPYIQMRCLCALESLMKEDVVGIDHLSSFLPQTLRQLHMAATDKLLQTKSLKILRQLERSQQEAAKSQVVYKDQTSGLTPAPQVDGTQLDISSDSPIHDVSTGAGPVKTTDSSQEKSLNATSPNLFAGMEVNSPVSKGKEETDCHQVASEANMIGTTSTAGSSENLLDELLDLSSTGQPMMLPYVGEYVQHNPYTNDNNVLRHVKMLKVAYEKESSASNQFENENRTQTSSDIANSANSKLLGYPPGASLDDLIVSTGLNDIKTSTDEPTPTESASDSVLLKPLGPMDTTPISKLYPQLAAANLSGSSTVPLRLGNRHPDVNFGFLDVGKTGAASIARFDFVKDAMKCSKK